MNHIYAQKDGDGKSPVNRIESRNGLHTLEHAKKIGLGSRTYTLIDIQKWFCKDGKKGYASGREMGKKEGHTAIPISQIKRL